jgi:hypothetical protein
MNAPFRPETIVTPKSFYVAERDRFYDDWMTAFWRELFQNSVDAGAKNIRISISKAPGKGSFGRAAAAKEAIRVVFDDDGHGMTKDVLDKVYFAPGETTKKDGASTGGYGRARLMTCFSQLRYGIRTLDRVVEGDGPLYTNLSVEEEIVQQAQYRIAAELDKKTAGESGDNAAWDAASDRVAQAISAEAALRQEAGEHRGCRLEIDLDPAEKPGSWSNPTVNRMQDALERYLSQSQIPCKVFIDGALTKTVATAKRGPARRTLSATLDAGQLPASWEGRDDIAVTKHPDGSASVEFATVHLSESETASYKRQMIVRVRGASMYVVSTGAPQQVILELNPAISRDLMTSNRDGLRNPWKQAVEDYLGFLATDANKALEAKKAEEFKIIKGGRGRNRATRPEREVDFSPIDEIPTLPPEARNVRQFYVSKDQYLESGFVGVPAKVMDAFLDVVAEKGASGTLLGHFHDQDAVMRFVDGIRSRDSEARHASLAEIGADLAEYIAATLLLRISEANQRRLETLGAMEHLNDVPIRKEDLDPEDPSLSAAEKKAMRHRMTSAIWRMTPTNWVDGKGARGRKILAAWTVAVGDVVQKLMTIYPRLDEFEWCAGFRFGYPKWEWNNKRNANGPVRTHASHEVRDGVHAFLINPMTDDCTALAYNTGAAADRDRLITIAIHEVGHVVTSRHDSEFAMVTTELHAIYGVAERQRLQRAMTMAAKASANAFDGRNQVHAMDDEEGPRPAERLLALSEGNPSAVPAPEEPAPLQP